MSAWLRVLLWSVRRELWEHRLVWMAPAAVGVFAALIQFLNVLITSGPQRAASLADRARPDSFMSHYNAVTGIVVISGLLVGALYCVGALHGERRDRSILFWKSLPVSDLTTVLSKVAVPLLVIPLTVLALAVGLSLAGVALQSAAWAATGFEIGALWGWLDLPEMWLGLVYALPFMALWYAPLYAWLLLVSAWAKRWPFLWAMAPFVAALIVEHTALHQSSAHWIVERWLGGGIVQPFTVGGAGSVWIHDVADFEPLRLWTLPTLWIGVGVAALLLFAAARVRRSRGPL